MAGGSADGLGRGTAGPWPGSVSSPSFGSAGGGAAGSTGVTGGNGRGGATLSSGITTSTGAVGGDQTGISNSTLIKALMSRSKPMVVATPMGMALICETRIMLTSLIQPLYLFHARDYPDENPSHSHLQPSPTLWAG